MGKRKSKVDSILEQFERDHAQIKKWHDETFARVNPAVELEIAEILNEPFVQTDITPLDERGRELMEKLRTTQTFIPAAFYSDIKSEIYKRPIRWGDTKMIKYARDRSVWDDVRDWVGDLCDWGIDHHVAANDIYIESDAFHYEGLICVSRSAPPEVVEKLIAAYVKLYKQIHGIAEPAAALQSIQAETEAVMQDAIAATIGAFQTVLKSKLVVQNAFATIKTGVVQFSAGGTLPPSILKQGNRAALIWMCNAYNAVEQGQAASMPDIELIKALAVRMSDMEKEIDATQNAAAAIIEERKSNGTITRQDERCFDKLLANQAQTNGAMNAMMAMMEKVLAGVDTAGRDARAGRIAAEKIADEFLGWRAWIAECVRKGGDVKVSPDKVKMFDAARDEIWKLWQRFKRGDADCEMPNNELRKQGQKRTYAECVELYGADVIYTTPGTGRMYYLREFCPTGDDLERVTHAADMDYKRHPEKMPKTIAAQSPHNYGA